MNLTEQGYDIYTENYERPLGKKDDQNKGKKIITFMDQKGLILLRWQRSPN